MAPSNTDRLFLLEYDDDLIPLAGRLTRQSILIGQLHGHLVGVGQGGDIHGYEQRDAHTEHLWRLSAVQGAIANEHLTPLALTSPLSSFRAEVHAISDTTPTPSLWSPCELVIDGDVTPAWEFQWARLTFRAASIDIPVIVIRTAEASGPWPAVRSIWTKVHN